MARQGDLEPEQHLEQRVQELQDLTFPLLGVHDSLQDKNKERTERCA